MKYNALYSVLLFASVAAKYPPSSDIDHEEEFQSAEPIYYFCKYVHMHDLRT